MLCFRNFFLDPDPELFVPDSDKNKNKQIQNENLTPFFSEFFALILQNIQLNVPLKSDSSSLILLFD